MDAPLLYATDTQWMHQALSPEARPRLFPRLISHSFKDVSHSSDQVEAFQKAGGTVVLCHDPAPTPFDFSQGAVL
jgi:hypothetical protein